MKNEFAENDSINSAINAVYQAMYKKSDRGIKNGETSLEVFPSIDCNIQTLKDGIAEYFNSQYANPTLKKYHINFEVIDNALIIGFKWGYHAIMANKSNVKINQV